MEQELIFSVVAKAKSGDQEAFTDLYNNAYKMVYLTCLGHMKNPEEAEDCAQETFITIYNKLDSLEDNNTFFGWAKTIAVRVCLHKLRSTHNNISYDDAIESGEKRVEYREIKPKYIPMFRDKKPACVRLAYGYSTRQMIWEIEKIVENDGCFELHLGKRLQ